MRHDVGEYGMEVGWKRLGKGGEHTFLIGQYDHDLFLRGNKKCAPSTGEGRGQLARKP
jgi:hypothetical protein